MDPSVLMGNIGYMANIFQDAAIVMGISLFMFGLFRLKRYAEARTMMSHHMTIAAPLMLMLGGVMFLCLPLVLGTALLNFWSTTSPLRYQVGNDAYDQLMPPVIMFVRLLGVGSFMRGILLLSRVGGEQSQAGSMGRACTHLLGGLLCMHILGVVQLLREIMGFTAGS